METSLNLDGCDWFHSVEENVVYVHYMNSSVFNVVPPNFKIHFIRFKEVKASDYKIDLGLLEDLDLSGDDEEE